MCIIEQHKDPLVQTNNWYYYISYVHCQSGNSYIVNLLKVSIPTFPNDWDLVLLLFFHWLAGGGQSRRTAALLHHHPTPHPLLHPVLWGEPVGEHQTTGYVPHNTHGPCNTVLLAHSLSISYYLFFCLSKVHSLSSPLLKEALCVRWREFVRRWEEKGSFCPLLSCRGCSLSGCAVIHPFLSWHRMLAAS